MSVCTSIVKVADDRNGDLLEVTIDNTVSALWFWPYADSLQYVNQEVIVEYRKDIYNGQMRQFIKTFTIPTVVNTLDKKDNFKLFLDQRDDKCSLSFNEIAVGESRLGCIVYCSHQEFKSSANATWMELLIRDKLMRVAKLRVFDPEDPNAELAGHYIVCPLSRSKYGFQSDNVHVAPGDAMENPEIELARQYIQNYFSDDVVAMGYINKIQMFDMLKEYVDYERGYVLMRMAMELALCDAMRNIANDVDLTAAGHVILTSFGYATRPNSVLSKTVNNVFLAQQFQFPNKNVVVTCLDEGLEEHDPVYTVVKKIKDTVDTILSIRKGFDM